MNSSTLWDASFPARSMFYLVTPSELEVKSAERISADAVPYFFLFALAEFIVARGDGYRVNDACASINSGMVQQLVTVWPKYAMLMFYAFLHAKLYAAPLARGGVPEFVLALLLNDLAYYALHRFLHEFHIGWATHSVHHSGQDYNQLTALRQGAFQWVFSFFFYAPIAIFIHPIPWATHSACNTLVQYYIHTEKISRLPCGLEYIFNSPSHHRMHHRPPGNRNYAGLLIIWDRIFGTFQAEEAQMDNYGLAKPLRTFDAVAANLEHASRIKAWAPDRWRSLLLCGRRVRPKAPWSLRALFTPLPNIKHASEYYAIFLQASLFVSYLSLSASISSGEVVYPTLLDVRGVKLVGAQLYAAAAASAIGRVQNDCTSMWTFNTARVVIANLVWGVIGSLTSHNAAQTVGMHAIVPSLALLDGVAWFTICALEFSRRDAAHVKTE